jgi:NADPH2:quinone reductase
MLAAFYARQGPARDVLVLSELNTPLPGPGEVRVRICSSGINPADVKRRAGAPARPMVWPIIIPHSDGAGVVDAVGSGVRSTREGDRVWVWNAQWRQPFGTAAQFAIVPAAQVVSLAPNVSFDDGAALGVPGLTAHRCVSVLARSSGERVLVYGAAGAIGNLLVQMMKARGAHVTAIVSSERKREIALEAGADLALDYSHPDHAEDLERLAGAEGFGVIADVDMGSHCMHYTQLVARHGQVVVFGSASNMRPAIDVLPLQKHGVSLHFIAGADQPPPQLAAAIEDVNDGVAAGALRPRIQCKFPLAEIATAHEVVEAGSLEGKVIVEVAHD